MIHIIVCWGNPVRKRIVEKWRQDFFVPVCREEERSAQESPDTRNRYFCFRNIPHFRTTNENSLSPLSFLFYSIRMERGGSFASWDRFQPS
ncbi:hypothetical protein CDAR_318611 [Caerostris darwini]|uniref:Ycf15 n=1 Tax=Caerostris darwini TaxID=1538125 RepID=A0AAV4Q580_9ARAC|nr:hypothetical protein CDAR_318611 [Caerostris darwini]